MYFYPRSPYGERRKSKRAINGLRHISIHALLTESDTWPLVIGPLIFISIHALLTESDVFAFTWLASCSYFYPRSPYGERLGTGFLQALLTLISIHALLTESDMPIYTITAED